MVGEKLWAAGVLAAALAAFAGDANAERSTRCAGGRLIDVGMVSAEILARCGEPKSRSLEEVPVRARLQSGAVVQTGITRVERWIYERGQGQFDALLTFEDDKLVEIELLTRR